jgi:hypothetical protein
VESAWLNLRNIFDGIYLDDHVIQDEKDLDRIRDYVVNNPLSWELGSLNLETLIPGLTAKTYWYVKPQKC